MIYGVYCVPNSGGSFTPSDNYLDFVGDVYKLDGSDIALSDAVDKPERRTDANGLFIDDSIGASGNVAVIGSFLAKFASSYFTVMFEYSVTPAWVGGGERPIYFEEDVSSGSRLDFLNGETVYKMFDESFTYTENDATGYPLDPTIIRIAFTRDSSHTALSVMGSSVAATSDSITAYVNAFITFGGPTRTGPSNNLGGYIRRLVLYPIQLDTELPVLSAIT